MRVRTLGDPALRLRRYPEGEELLRIPFGTEIEVINWNAEPDWALVSFQDEVGYAMKKFLEQLPDPEPAPVLAFSAPISAPLENPSYVVLQVKMDLPNFPRGVHELTELEQVINEYAARGYRLHTISTGEKGMMLQFNVVFEKI